MKTTSLLSLLRRLLLAATMLTHFTAPVLAQMPDDVIPVGPMLLSPEQLQWLISRMLGRQAAAGRSPSASRSQQPTTPAAPGSAASPVTTTVPSPAPTTPAPAPMPTAAPAPTADDADRPDIRFTAVDGREVDLASLRGKVVLIDFWATWCGPCMGEIPNVVDAYHQFHDRGFEIIGISFDTNRAALERVVKSKDMPWPQYFDGKGWKNDFGVKFGIHGIPTMWLIDDEGRIVSRNARSDLAGKVRRLLEAAGR